VSSACALSGWHGAWSHNQDVSDRYYNLKIFMNTAGNGPNGLE
jgi:hypothetical protein